MALWAVAFSAGRSLNPIRTLASWTKPFCRCLQHSLVAESANAVWVTTNLPPVNLSVIRHSASAPSGLNGGIAFNARDAAAFALIRHSALRRFVFVNARKFDLEPLFAECPDFEFAAFRFPRAIHLSGRHTLVSIRAGDKRKRSCQAQQH